MLHAVYDIILTINLDIDPPYHILDGECAMEKICDHPPLLPKITID